MSDPDDELDAVQQRTVSAADGSPLRTAAASSVFNWRGAGTAAAPAPDPEPTAAAPSPQPEEEEPMARTKAAARTRRKPIPLILQLIADIPASRKQIGEQLQLSTSVLHNNLGKLKAQKLVAVDAEGSYSITDKGRAALAEANGEAPQQRSKRTRTARQSVAHRRARRARAPAKPQAPQVDTSPAKPEGSFRCAVMSDGCFFLSKEGVVIELEPEEHAHMLRYLERMAEEAA